MATLGLKWLPGEREPYHLILHVTDRRERQTAASLPGARWSNHSDNVYYAPEPAILERLDQLLGSALAIDADAKAWYETLMDKLDAGWNLQQEGDVNCAAPWASRLYPYQRVGAAWLSQTRYAILGDDPGLGKTIQALTAVRAQKNVLIVTLNAVKGHWARHVREWLRRPVAVADGTRAMRQAILNDLPDWLVINHEMLRPGAAQFDNIFNRKWDAVIIDEAHKLQGRNSQQSKGAELLDTDRMLLLTGTPIWNRPDSLWHLLKLLAPRRFGSYWRFVDEYCDTYVSPWTTEILGVKPSMQGQLQNVLAQFLLRRAKKDVLPSLPDKIYATIEYDLSPTLRVAYRTLRRSLRLEPEPGNVATTYPNVGAMLADLRMLINVPASKGLKTESPKDAILDDLLDTLLGEGRKVVIYTWHKVYADYLYRRFLKRGCILVTGDTPERDIAIQLFRTVADYPVLVATIGAAGTGIDLTECTAAIFAEGSYVHTLNNQAEDRLHRIGTKDSPLIYRLVGRHTIEQAVWETADDTSDQANELLALEAVVQRLRTE